jgi:hypothetical protein
MEVTRNLERRRKKPLDDLKGQVRILSSERGRTRSHHAEKQFWKRLWTGRKSERILNE